jgi:hypothetical protein
MLLLVVEVALAVVVELYIVLEINIPNIDLIVLNLN